MNNPSLFCSPIIKQCNLMSEWAVYWQAVGTVIAMIVGLVGLYKIFHELRRLNEQRKKDQDDKEASAKLKRTEFFLSQHRRLFDNQDLYDVLCLVDADNIKLREEEMWDKKRKFLAFIEEIALLVESGQLNRNAAFYMFGHYARCAIEGDNFSEGIDLSPQHWRLLFSFCRSAEEFARTNPAGPPQLNL